MKCTGYDYSYVGSWKDVGESAFISLVNLCYLANVMSCSGVISASS